MPNFEKTHISIDGRRIVRPYQDRRRNSGVSRVPRTRAEHGARVRERLETALAETRQARPVNGELPPTTGTYIEVELVPGKHAETTIDRKSQGMRSGAVHKLPNEYEKVVFFVPDSAEGYLLNVLNDYTTGELTPKGNPKYKALVEPIQDFRRAFLESFWTDDPDALPQQPNDSIWWELWCFKGTEFETVDLVQRLGAQVAEEGAWMYFPETVVVPAYATRATIELLLFAPFSLLELRRASASTALFAEADSDEQAQWVEGLAERIAWPNEDAPAVCLFDSGVNRAHALIEPTLSAEDSMAVREEWGTDDSKRHGTLMAGLCLYGDLVPKIVDDSEVTLKHRLESVKLIPPDGFPPNEPAAYGPITHAAVALAEINAPTRRRVICMAVSNKDVSGDHVSSWSASIDQAAFGTMHGDDERAPKRLIILSAGNIPAEIERHRIGPNDDYAIEDPSQAWNALTVGGYTEKVQITEDAFDGHSPFAGFGELSPYSRTSVQWNSSRSPYKPDIVMEAGNRALSPNEQEVYSTDSLSLLTTGSNVDQQPLTAFAATSAASAQAARLAARLMSKFPEYWPEMIRALIVHSAEWTSAMRTELDACNGLKERYPLIRRYGYGVPSLSRARASAENHLALTAQSTIQPFQTADGRRKFRDCHYYSLPWPRGTLEEMGDALVRLKVTLSYFIEPNPGGSYNVNPGRYQSYGLRFDLKRPLESRQQFLQRVNTLEREDPRAKVPPAKPDSRWLLGSNSISAGSLHCDVWHGPAAELAERDLLCIRPIAGWWRDRTQAAFVQAEGRYALVATLETASEVDLYAQIEHVIKTEVGIEIPVR